MKPKAVTPDEVVAQVALLDDPAVRDLVESINEFLRRSWRGSKINVVVKDKASTVIDSMIMIFGEVGWDVRRGSLYSGTVDLTFDRKKPQPQYE